MSKKRVHEIAKAQGVSSKELLAALKAAGVEAKAAASTVEEADRTNSPSSWSLAMTTLLSTPSSFASS